MKNNVINNRFVVECFNGSLEIIGSSIYRRGSVVFRLRGSAVEGLMGSQPAFCRNTIFTRDIESFENVLIFEYNLRKELNNPRKLLKSVRNKLVQAGFRNQREDDKKYHKMYTVPDREEHRMFAEETEDRTPLP